MCYVDAIPKIRSPSRKWTRTGRTHPNGRRAVEAQPEDAVPVLLLVCGAAAVHVDLDTAVKPTYCLRTARLRLKGRSKQNSSRKLRFWAEKVATRAWHDKMGKISVGFTAMSQQYAADMTKGLTGVVNSQWQTSHRDHGGVGTGLGDAWILRDDVRQEVAWLVALPPITGIYEQRTHIWTFCHEVSGFTKLDETA